MQDIWFLRNAGGFILLCIVNIKKKIWVNATQ